MNAELRSRYLSALGIDAFLHQNNATHDLAENVKNNTKKTRCLVIETQKSQSCCVPGEAQNLLLKMFSAIDLAADDMICSAINIDDIHPFLDNFDAEVVVVLDAAFKITKPHHFIIHHPDAILADKTLKRQVWEVLQKVQKCLK